MNMPRELRFFLERVNYGRAVALHAGGEDARGVMRRLKAVAFEEVPDAERDAIVMEPPLVMSQPQAQQLADELWALGIRPTQGQQGEGERGAMQAHLQDLRHLVSHLAKVPLPGIPPAPKPQ